MTETTYPTDRDAVAQQYRATISAAVRILEHHARQCRDAVEDRTDLAARADTATQAARYYAQADRDRAAALAYTDAARLVAAALDELPR